MPILVGAPESGLGEGISGLAGILGQALQARQGRQRQALTGNLLQQGLAQLGENPTAAQYGSVLSNALAQGASPEIIQQFGPVLQRFAETERKAPLKVEQLSDVFEILKQHMPEEKARQLVNLYPQLSTGGQTQFSQYLFDLIQRGEKPGIAPELSEQISEETAVEFPEVKPFEGLTPKEVVARQKELFKTNAVSYSELNKKIRGSEGEERSLGQLERLNDSGKLPKGFLKGLDVDFKTGDLRIPAWSSPEAQLFVKTVNDFTTKAKETYGSRISNFELNTFLKRLPTLANSPEGRRVIIEQMSAINQLNTLYDQSLKEVYDKYGLRNIDPQQAQKIAEDRLQDEKEVALQRFKEAPRAQERFIAKQNIPPGHELMIFNDEFIYVPKDQVSKALEKGARLR